MSHISNSYLMWVGTEHYPTIEDWAKEAITHGVSKRLPGAAVGVKMMEPGTVIFVAHDEGEFNPCPECSGVIECPDCRKLQAEATRVSGEIAKLLKRYDGDRDAFAADASGSQKRSLKVRDAKLDELSHEMNECKTCDGVGTCKASTGGTVVLSSGKAVDYRTYNYWLHQPGKFSPESEVVSKEMCGCCGGTGKLPNSKIFGMFIPSAVEYIVEGNESEMEMERVKDFAKVAHATVVKEVKRGCGRRKVRGVYAVTSPEGGTKAAKAALAELVAKGLVKPEATEISGSFIRFIEPIEVDVKRFRGIKSWSLNPDVEDAAEDILDAMSA